MACSHHEFKGFSETLLTHTLTPKKCEAASARRDTPETAYTPVIPDPRQPLSQSLSEGIRMKR